jgi:hypothetical protein
VYKIGEEYGQLNILHEVVGLDETNQHHIKAEI